MNALAKKKRKSRPKTTAKKKRKSRSKTKTNIRKIFQSGLIDLIVGILVALCGYLIEQLL